MSYFFWLGRKAEKAMKDEEDAIFFRNEIIARQSECKPEADGFITIHPKASR
jgi:hypothetical protein